MDTDFDPRKLTVEQLLQEGIQDLQHDLPGLLCALRDQDTTTQSWPPNQIPVAPL